MSTINKIYSGLIVWSFEIPNAPYSQRYYLLDVNFSGAYNHAINPTKNAHVFVGSVESVKILGI